METPEKEKPNYRPVLGLALISLVICGLFFPLLVTGIAQVLLPYQANGELKQLDGRNVGSELIEQSFNSSEFFQPRLANQSASTVDPDITVQDALGQVSRISGATGIPSSNLTALINANEEGTFWIFGYPYVDVLNLNLVLINDFPIVYQNFTT